MKNYLIKDPDPTLSQMRCLIVLLWAVTISIIISMFVKTPPLLNPPGEKVYELNGYIPGTNQTWGNIKGAK